MAQSITEAPRPPATALDGEAVQQEIPIIAPATAPPSKPRRRYPPLNHHEIRQWALLMPAPTPAHRFFLLVLVEFLTPRSPNACWPAHRTLEKLTTYRERHQRDLTRYWQSQGVIDCYARRTRKGKGRQTSNRYVIHYNRVTTPEFYNLLGEPDLQPGDEFELQLVDSQG